MRVVKIKKWEDFEKLYSTQDDDFNLSDGILFTKEMEYLCGRVISLKTFARDDKTKFWNIFNDITGDEWRFSEEMAACEYTKETNPEYFI